MTSQKVIHPLVIKQFSSQTLLLVIFTCLTIKSGSCLANTTPFKQHMESEKTKWTSAYNVEITSVQINVFISVSLLVPKNVPRHSLNIQKVLWQKSIDKIWNNRFYIHKGYTTLPIKINVKFTHFKPHHKVLIHAGIWVPNQHNWYLNIPPNLVAHEVGHMLGAFDEYRGGALAPLHPIIDTTSIMGSKSKQGIAYPRHLKLLETFLVEKLGDKKITVKSR